MNNLFKSFKKKKSLIFLFLFLIISVYGFSQSGGTLKGIVTDKDSGEPLIDVNVSIPAAGKGTLTELDGDYVIGNIPPGRYKVFFNYIGYANDTAVVTITAGSTITLDRQLSGEEKSVVNIVVYGEKPTETVAAVIQEIKEADQVVSGISSEQITKSLDRDAAAVVRRIPGVTIIQDRYIVVRGLSERYNAVMLNNVYAPSLEADVRSFSFDIIPVNMIDRIMVYKSPAPELPGDFAGGLVKIYTKGIPEKNGIDISYSGSYRQGTSLRTFLNQERGRGHWTGFNDGRFNMPGGIDGFPKLRSISNDIGKTIDASRSLANNWSPFEYNSGLDHRFNATGNLKFNIGSVKVGSVTSLNYNNKKAILDIRVRGYEQYDFVNQKENPRFDFMDRQYNQDILAGIIQNWAFRFNGNHSIEFKNMFNQMASYSYIDRLGENFAQSFRLNNHAFMNVYRGVYSGQLIGKHNFNEDKTKLTWGGGYGYSYRDMPDYRRYRTDVTDDPENPRRIFIPIAQSPNFFGKFYSEMNEHSVSGNANLEQELGLKLFSENTVSIKTGVFVEERSRNFVARNIGFTRSRFDEFNSDLQYVPMDSLFQPGNINFEDGIIARESTNPQDSYEAQNSLFASYMQFNVPVSDRLKVITGARVEHNIQRLQSQTSTEVIDVNNPLTAILPSVNVSYNFTPKMLARFAYGKTLNRPEFRELAPFSFYDFSFDATRIGNENLVTAIIHNYDLRWELYPSDNETITIGAFYKRFINPIESLFMSGGSEASVFGFVNAQSAYNQGIELEIRKSFAGLTNIKFLDDLSLLVNTSLIHSRVDLDDVSAGIRSIRPLQGQSPYIVNSGIFYNNDRHNLQINAMYNVLGKRIVFVGDQFTPETWEMPRHVIDLNITKSITKWLQFRAGIRDLLNQDVLLIQDGNEDGIIERNGDQVIRKFKPGSIFTVGFGLKL